MSKIAVVYWSGTGNTEMMANAVAEGARGAGAEADVLTCAEFSEAQIPGYDAFAFGCPSMGAEQLEESEFEPMFTSVEGALAGKKVGLFGSWGWGEGAWMVDWEARCKGDGMELVPSVTCCNTPYDAALDECKALGASLT